MNNFNKSKSTKFFSKEFKENNRIKFFFFFFFFIPVKKDTQRIAIKEKKK